MAFEPKQARFALSSSSIFNKHNSVTCSEQFYGKILDFLDNPEEILEVDRLVGWWNRSVYLSLL